MNRMCDFSQIFKFEQTLRFFLGHACCHEQQPCALENNQFAENEHDPTTISLCDTQHFLLKLPCQVSSFFLFYTFKSPMSEKSSISIAMALPWVGCDKKGKKCQIIVTA